MRRAVTLVELLVVISILALGLAISLPATLGARESARRTQCQTRFRQVAVAIETYHDAHGRFPPGCFFGKFGKGPTSTAWSWMALILPQLEESPLHARGGVPHKPLDQSPIVGATITPLLCPSDDANPRPPRTDRGNLRGLAVGVTNLQAVSGSNWGADKSQKLDDIESDWPHASASGSRDGWDEGDGIMFRTDYKIRRAKRDVKDGLSKTWLLGEQLPDKNTWCSWPYANNAYGTCAIPPNVVGKPGHIYWPSYWPNVAGFRSNHGGGLNFATASASVHFVNDAIDLTLYRALATINGHEAVAVPSP